MLINTHTCPWLLTLYLLPVEVTGLAGSSTESILCMASAHASFFRVPNKHLSAESLTIVAAASVLISWEFVSLLTLG